MKKRLMYGNAAREQLLNGVKKLYQAVSSTMGPRFRNVLIYHRDIPPTSTNDGVTVARNISLPDDWEDAGAQVVRDIAVKTNEDAGDGTTTATVLAYAIMKEGNDLINVGNLNPVSVKEGIDLACADVVAELKGFATEIKSKDQIQQIATLSAQDEKIGEVIADVLDKVGVNSVVTIEDSPVPGFSSTIVDGYQISSGYYTQYLINDERGKNITTHPQIIVTDEEITSIQQLGSLFQSFKDNAIKDITIIAPGFAGEALLALVRSHQGKLYNISLIKIGGVREKQVEILQDIATVVGAQFISGSLGKKMSTATLKDAGTAKKVECSKNESVIVAPAGKQDEIDKRKAHLTAVMNDAKSEYEKEQIKERIARIDGSISVIYVGAHTEIEQKAKKFKLEDALNAARASIEEGIVPGGGATLVKIHKTLSDKEMESALSEDVMMGYVVVLNALLYPFKKILENAGIERIAIEGELGGVDEILMKTKNRSDDYGYDARNLCYCNLIEAGIIDPVRVTRSALQNACSAAGQLLTTEVIITNEPENTTLDNQQNV